MQRIKGIVTNSIPDIRIKGISEIAKIFNNGETPEKIRMSRQGGGKEKEPFSSPTTEAPKEQRKKEEGVRRRIAEKEVENDSFAGRGEEILKKMLNMEDKTAKEAGRRREEWSMDYTTPNKRTREELESSREDEISQANTPFHKKIVMEREDGEDENGEGEGRMEEGEKEKEDTEENLHPQLKEILSKLTVAMCNGMLMKEDPAKLLFNISSAFGEVQKMIEKMGVEGIPYEGEKEKKREEEKEDSAEARWREERMLEKTKRSIIAQGIEYWDLGLDSMREIDMAIQAEIVTTISGYSCNVEEVRINKNAAGNPISAMIIFSSYGNKLNFFRCVANHMKNRTEAGRRMARVSFRDCFAPEHNEDYRDLMKEGMERKKKGKITSFRIVARSHRCCPVLEGRNKNGAWHIIESRYCNGDKQEGRGRQKRKENESRSRRRSESRSRGMNGAAPNFNAADKYLGTRIELGEEAKKIMKENPEEYYWQLQHKLYDLEGEIKRLEGFRSECETTEKWREYQDKRDREEEGTQEEY